MKPLNRTWSAILAACLFLVLLAPPVKHVLEASMTAQMLAQIPLLILVGWLLQGAIPERVRLVLTDWNGYGLAGVTLTIMASAYWMLPRALDASVSDALVELAKYLTVPLLIGLPFALSWPQMNFIVRGVFLLELIATFFRLGWLYVSSPSRLCNNYLLDDQQRLGEYMLVIGCVLLVWVAGKLLFGRFNSLSNG